MATRPSAVLLRHLRRLTSDPANIGRSDRELLARFAAWQEEAAFATLVRRHGPLVLGVCRRTLPNSPDAEDAFQATWLAFVRKAPSIARGAALGSWLYRVALRARAGLTRRS